MMGDKFNISRTDGGHMTKRRPVDPHVWIVEMYVNRKWAVTDGAAITRVDGLRLADVWRNQMRHDKFRLRKYVREKNACSMRGGRNER